MIDSIAFYWPQILMGSIIGMLVALLGVFVVLRKMIFAGVALSQAASAAVVLTLLLELHSEPIVFALTFAVFVPFYALQHRFDRHPDAVLAGALVFFSALSQILLSLGGGAQNHLITAFFGNILTMPDTEWKHLWIPSVLGGLAFILLYRPLLSVSFDRTYARTSGIRPLAIELPFFFILMASLTTAIYLMGSFYTIAHLIIPGLVGLAFARSMRTAFLLAALISVVATVTGFTLSLVPISVAGQTLNLPTSSTVILALCAFIPLLVFRRD